MISDSFKNQPGPLRLAWALFDLFNEEVGFAFPSREYLAQKMGSHENTISSWTTVLRQAGAISTQTNALVHPDLRRTRDPRSLVYVLNMAWADAVISLHESREGLSGARPALSRSVVETASETLVEITTDMPRGDRYTDNVSGQSTDNGDKTGADVRQSSVYVRSLGNELPLDPPDTIDEAVLWLKTRGLTDAEVVQMAPVLCAGRLYRSQIDELVGSKRKAA